MALNVITADLSGCGQSVIATPGLVQWDRGQVLKIIGAELPAAYIVEFSNPGDHQTVAMVGDENGVYVPNILLQTGRPIIAYLVITGEDQRETEYWISISVKPRELPPGDIPDPEQASAIDQAIAALNDAVEECEEIAEGISVEIEDAEAWAAGTRGGEPVSTEDPAYHNNSKYWAEESEQLGKARAEDAEAWAIGKRDGHFVPPKDPTYRNNAKYYADIAQQQIEGSGYAWFDVHDDDGCMYVYLSENLSEDITFAVNETLGILEVTYN